MFKIRAAVLIGLMISAYGNNALCRTWRNNLQFALFACHTLGQKCIDHESAFFGR